MKKNFKGYLLAAGLITAAIAAAITVSCLGKHGVYGDVNSDNSVDSGDLVRLMKYIAANGDGIEAHGADLNGDGIVDTRDLIRLMKYISDPENNKPGPIVEDNALPEDPDRYTGEYSEVNGALAGTDSLGRTVPLTDSGINEKKVGIFYFLWQGEHGTDGPYDNDKIVASDPSAIRSEANWLAAGGGAQGAHHFWGEPLFGYYRSADTWVMRKHFQMLKDAGVDFIVFDATNGFTYTERVYEMIEIWNEYYEKGIDVPQLAFYTNSNSGATMRNIYDQIYNNADLRKAYPNLDKLWFNWNGKPMIVGVSAEADDELKSYFTIKESQWPNAERTDNGNGFPWMEFGRLLTEDAVYGVDGRREVISVSVAQHSTTSRFSATAWYGGNDRTRSWHNGANDTSEGAEQYGYNFDEQFDFAIAQDTEMIFITGWNEWVAQRQSPTMVPGEPILFIDCATPNCSRDIEPMSGGFGDNYYMQMAERIAEYKGSAKRVNTGRNVTIDVGGSFAQWESDEITAVYTDYSNDIGSRSMTGFGGIRYDDYSGRNDLTLMKTARGRDNIYFYAETANDIRSSGKEGRMTLFIGTGEENSFSGFGYAVNLGSSDGKKAPLVRLASDGSSTVIGEVDMKVEEDQIMFAVPRSLIGCADGLVDITFKWADGFAINDGKIDIMTFYSQGDAAPIGRFAYVFSEKK